MVVVRSSGSVSIRGSTNSSVVNNINIFHEFIIHTFIPFFSETGIVGRKVETITDIGVIEAPRSTISILNFLFSKNQVFELVEILLYVVKKSSLRLPTASFRFTLLFGYSEIPVIFLKKLIFN